MSDKDRIVLHIAGLDRPGVTAKLTQVIAEENAKLINIGQSVLHGYLTMSAIVDIPPTSQALRKILFAVSDEGLKIELSPFVPQQLQPAAATSIIVTLLGALGSGSAVSEVTQYMASRNMNIREMRPLSDDGVKGLDLIADHPGDELDEAELSQLRADLLAVGTRRHIDMAVQKDDIFRRSKRLVCMDVDSTFVKGEFIDDLAELVGVKDKVAAITKRAMQGELDFTEALRERVQLLKGLPLEKVRALCENFELSPGAENFVRTLKSLGFRVGLVSGGFDIFVDELRSRFGLDFSFANELEIADGCLTGNVIGTVVDPGRKAQVLRDMARVYKCRLEQTVAIGDGANDMLMLQTAGLGIAYHAKPKLQEVADMSLNHNAGLDSLLFLMGFTARDLMRVRRG